MGLCKCPKRKITNLFCFEHGVNVCEYCLVSDHERCIVQSYVQWLQDSDYNPNCIFCKKLLKDEPTVRLVCLDVFHWSCLNKYAFELPVDTAPAGYQCPKCKECIFPPHNLVSPVVEELRKKLETAKWARAGLGQSLLQADESPNFNDDDIKRPLLDKESQPTPGTSGSTDDESNGFVIVSQKNNTKKAVTSPQITHQESIKSQQQSIPAAAGVSKPAAIHKKSDIPSISSSSTTTSTQNRVNKFDVSELDTITPASSYNRAATHVSSNQDQFYDPSLGIVLNIDKLDRDTGENKYKRRPLFEWLSRFIRSRQLGGKRFRMTRQKKILFIVLVCLMALFTLIIVFSRLGEMSTENDPALDPFNNPNIRVE